MQQMTGHTVEVGGNFGLSPVTVSKEFLLVVEKFFTSLRRELLVLRCTIVIQNMSAKNGSTEVYGIVKHAEREMCTYSQR